MAGIVHTKLARNAAEYFVRHHEIMTLPAVVPPELQLQKACYVTIHENPGRRIRCLYGSALPNRTCLAEEIVMNTIRAITDGSTRTVRRADLPYLAYTVAVVDPLERINGPEHLDPFVYGLYVWSDRGKTAVLLPQRVGVETAEDQVATAMRESGIDPRREAVSLYRFRVHYYE